VEYLAAWGYPYVFEHFRFHLTLTFDDYSDDQLVEIFSRMAAAADFTPAPDALDRLRALLTAEPRDEGFGNARFVRNIFEAAVTKQAMRVAPLSDPSTEQLTTLTVADIVG
jgi:hypothetical protein